MTAAAREVFETDSPDETIALGAKLAGRLGVGDCVAMVGGLGAGKTVLAKGLAVGMGLSDPRSVTSPTFVIVHEYSGRVPVFHLDLYRLTGGAEELADLGLDEMLTAGVVLVEWPERAEAALPAGRWQITIEITGRTRRRFTVARIS